MAKLVAQSGPTAGREFPLTKEVTCLGRQSTQDVQIVDNMASRAHCEIRRDGRFYTLVDLGSRNGTLLNNRKVGERLMAFGDRIRVGEVEFLLVKEPGDVELADLLTKYELKEKLGEGGMGIVYKAVQKSMAREVALKILAPRHSAKPKFVEQFINEARAAGKLNHHHLIQVHDVSTENDLHYFSMEYVDGPTAMEMLRRQGPFEVDEAVEIIRQVSRALAYAHDHRLIHQDIKPDNIMIGTGSVVKLADLGISKSFDQAEAEVDNKKIMGTPAYMAPEAALGKRIDHRVDLYSLGATFYHLLTGKTPYAAPTPTEVLKAHVTLPVPSVRELAPTVPEAVDRLIQRMMAKSAEERPQSAAEVEKALDALDLPRSDKGGATETNLLRRYAAGTTTREDTPESLPPQAPPPKRSPIGLVAGLLVLVAAGGAGAAVALRGEAPTTPTTAAPVPEQAPAPTTPVAPVAEPAKPDPGRAALEAQLSELDGLLSKPLEQINLAEARARVQALPAAAPKDQAARSAALVRRLTDLETQVATAKVLEQFGQVRAEAQSLAEEHQFQAALARLDAFPAKDHKAVAERVNETRQEIERTRKALVTELDDRAQSLAQRKDLDGLKDLQESLPSELAKGPVGIRIQETIQAILSERQAQVAQHLAAGAKDFREWEFTAVAERAALQSRLLAGSPAEAQFKDWIAAGRQLDQLSVAIATRLVSLRQQRFRGILAGFKDPDLMSADRERGLELKEANGGAVFLRWGKIPAKDLQAVADLLLRQDAAQFKPAIEALGAAAAQAK